MPQTVLITGASGGLGKAFAREFAEHGFNLTLTYKAEAFAVRVAPKTLVSRIIKKWQGGLIEKGNKI